MFARKAIGLAIFVSGSAVIVVHLLRRVSDVQTSKTGVAHLISRQSRDANVGRLELQSSALAAGNPTLGLLFLAFRRDQRRHKVNRRGNELTPKSWTLKR
jgi:hypothetical protein